MSLSQAEQTAQISLVRSRSDLRAVLGLALPILGEQFLEFLVGIADTWLAGNSISPENSVPAMAAVGLMAYSIWMMFVIFASVGIGATAVVARRFGEGQFGEARKSTEQAISLGIGFSLVITFVFWLLADDFVSAMQLEGKAYDMALEYLLILLPAVPGFMMIAVATACQHGAGDTVTGLIVMSIVNVLNIAISATLAMGVGPLPTMGWTGIALGTSISHIIGGLLLFAILVRGRANLRITIKGLWPHFPLMKRLLRIGIPGGLNDAVILSCHLWYLSVINYLGTTQAAAHGLAVRIESPGYLSAWAFAVAASALTGQHLGAGSPQRATRATMVSTGLGAMLLSSYGVLVLFAGHWMVQFFLGFPSPDSEASATGDLSNQILWIVAAGLPFLAVSSVLGGALRGAGDTTWPLLITLIGFLLIRLPGAYYLAWDEISIPWFNLTFPGCGLGLFGAWIAMLADVIVRMLLVVGRYLHGAWKKIEV